MELTILRSVIGAIIATTAVQAALQIDYLPGVWFQDIRFYTTVAILVSLVFVFVIQYIEHWRSRNPNGVVLFYWVFFVLANGVKLRSLVERDADKERLPYFIAFNVSLGLAVLEFVLEYFVPKKQSAYDALGAEDECPYEYADIFSVLTFGWMTPMMKFGYKNFLTQDDLWNLRERDSTRVTGDILQKAWELELEKKKPNLWIALARSFGGPYLRGAMIKTVSDCLAFIQPQLLRLLITFVDSYRPGRDRQPAIRGVAIALGMFATSICQTAALHQYFQRAFETGMRVKSSLTAMIYSKSLRLSNESRATKSTGDIVTYMSVDQQRLADLAQWGQQVWSAPFQITLCMISLYQLVGVSCLAGVAAMVIMIPINGFIARFMKKLQLSQMKYKDRRSRLMTEILNNMKSIKLYAWGSAFMDKLSHVRNDLELNNLRKIGAAQSFATFTWSSTPFFVSCSTFAVFVLVNNKPLTTDLVFPALTLFNLLTFPLTVLPMVITSIIEATVAVKRLTDFFTTDELQEDAVRLIDEPVKQSGETSVSIKDATFTWDKNSGRNVLSNINFNANKGELTCIVGRVGAGKSSLLSSMLGDLYKLNGETVVRGRIAYAAQSAWIMNASVKENIVFGHRWDPHFYDQTINACALVDDFRTLPDGDQTEVGERGISLSGGQKARLALARAVYARADIYLMDDVLSAVDQHVGRHLINNVLGPNGLLNGKARILATNAINVLKEADYMYLIRDGSILEKGTYEQLMAMRGEIANLVKSVASEDQETESERSPSIEGMESDDSTTVVNSSGIHDELDAEEAEESRQEVGGLMPIRPAPLGSSKAGRKSSYNTLRRASTTSFHGPMGRLTDEEGGGLKSKQTKETQEQGKVKWSVYTSYAKESNLIAVGVYFCALLLAQTAQIGGSFWLKRWSEINESAGSNPQVGKYIGIYFAFGIGGAALVVVQVCTCHLLCFASRFYLPGVMRSGVGRQCWHRPETLEMSDRSSDQSHCLCDYRKSSPLWQWLYSHI
jgi:ATP-binding cassette, subfamily C (CFTR/MRP), member 1